MLARWRRVADVVAATAQIATETCHESIDRAARAIPAGAIGDGGQVALVFVSVANKAM